MRELLDKISGAVDKALGGKILPSAAASSVPVEGQKMAPVRAVSTKSRSSSSQGSHVSPLASSSNAQSQAKAAQAAETVQPGREQESNNASGSGEDIKIDDVNPNTFEGDVVTSNAGKLRIPEESRNLCALFDNGMWLVSAAHRHSPLVTSVAQAARRKGYVINTPRYVTPNIIRQAYIYAERQQTVSQLDDNAVRRKIVDVIERAASMGANDIHIDASENGTRIEFRIDGALRLWENWTQREGEMMLSAIYAHSVGQSGATANWQEPQAAMLTGTAVGRDAIILPKGVISMRCQWVPLADGGRYLDMRLNYDSAHLFGENFIMADVDSLGFSQEQLKVIQSLRTAPGGMRVFAGPVNQGKTTTLRLTLNRRMAETNMQLNCLMIEDPPEGGVIGARQIGVSASVKDEQREKTFVEIMRCALRLDPDIVMLGEIRDIQTANFAFRLALTGRQVYTTTHVYSALAIPQRLRDIGIDTYLVYDHHLLRGMICQRLLRGLCPKCRIPLSKAVEELGPSYNDVVRRTRAGLALMDAERGHAIVGSVFDRLSEPDMRNVYVANPEGCPQCFKGRVGRTVCAEVIETDQKLMSLLSENKMEEASNYWLSPSGLRGVTMMWHALEKVRRGEISPTDAEMDIGFLARERDMLEVEQRLGSIT